MIAQLLPGIRHWRTPFVGGALWLFVAWLVWGRHWPTPDRASGLFADIYALADYVGTVGVLGAAALAAYVLGIQMQWLVSQLRSKASGVWYKLPIFKPREIPPLSPYLGAAQLSEILDEYEARHPDPQIDRRAQQTARLRDAIALEVAEAGFHWPVTVPDLAAELERREAEREFAVGTATPLVVVALALTASAPEIVPVGIVMGWLGVAQMLRARHIDAGMERLVLEAVLTGRAKAPRLHEVFQDWHEITGLLPGAARTLLGREPANIDEGKT